MRRSVESALASVRATFKRDERALSGPAWSVARVLADEVERLHKQLDTAKRLTSDEADGLLALQTCIAAADYSSLQWQADLDQLAFSVLPGLLEKKP